MENVIGEKAEPGTRDARNASEMLPLVYERLCHLAAARLAREKPDETLQPTALVHETWLRVRNSNGDHWDSQGHFFGAAARAMRRILVEKARRKQAEKRGGTTQLVQFHEVEIAAPIPDDELLAIDDALDQLSWVNPLAAKLVKLRFFAGLTQAEAAAELGFSRSTADRLWRFARIWLMSRVYPGSAEAEPGRANS